jgi:hypothetical protein
MTVSIPESVFAEGNVKAAIVPAIANLATGPTLAEMNAGIIISCYLMPDWDGFTGTQNKGESRRFCSRKSLQQLGRSTDEVAPLMYTYLPQELGTPGTEGNELYETLAPGTRHYLVIGFGLDAEEGAPFVATDIVDYAQIEAGEQYKQSRGSDEFAPLVVQQELAVTGLKYTDKAIAA